MERSQTLPGLRGGVGSVPRSRRGDGTDFAQGSEVVVLACQSITLVAAGRIGWRRLSGDQDVSEEAGLKCASQGSFPRPSLVKEQVSLI